MSGAALATPSARPPSRFSRLMGNRRLVLTASDQVLSSASNFVIGVLVGRLAGPGPFGAYILAFTLWLVVLGIHRALVAEPIVISGALDGDRPVVLRRGLEADLLLAVGIAAVVVVAGAILTAVGSGEIGMALLMIAAFLPVLIAQDYWRAMAFALHRPGVALVNDGIFVAVQVAALALVVALGGRTAPWFILAWGAGASAGALVGFFQFRVHPFRRGAGPLFSHNWPFSRWLLADFLTIFAADQTYLLLVAALLGQAAFGELKAALSLMGPTAVILLTGGNVGLPTLARANARDGLAGIVEVSRKLTRLVGAAVVAYCLVVFVAGPQLLTWIYGSQFSSAGNLARIGAITYAVAVGSFGAGIAIRVLRQARTMWTARLVVTTVSVAAVLVLSSLFGITGAAWAGVLTAVAGTAATLLVFRRILATRRTEAAARLGIPLPPPVPGTAQLWTANLLDAPWPPPGPGAGVVLGLSVAEGADALADVDTGLSASSPGHPAVPGTSPRG